MYPLDTSRGYPRDQWYIAGYGFEFGKRPIGRRILGNPLLFYRAEDGEPIALWGLCAHRFMPLGKATRDGDAIICPYHGYRYGKDGRCQFIPTGGTPSPHARLAKYPLIERGPIVWIWMGDPARPDMSKFPDASDIGLGANSGGWRVDPARTYLMRARPALLMDNLFDLSHLAFIHEQSIPGGAQLCMVPPRIETLGGRFRVGRTIAGMAIEPGSRRAQMVPVARGHEQLTGLLHTEYYGPGLVNASGPWLFATNSNGEPGDAVAKLNFVHGITPETEYSTHYFGIMTRDYSLEDNDLSTALVAQTDRVRAEDVEALEAVEQNADKFASARAEISTKVDEGALRVRRLLRKTIDAELASHTRETP